MEWDGQSFYNELETLLAKDSLSPKTIVIVFDINRWDYSTIHHLSFEIMIPLQQYYNNLIYFNYEAHLNENPPSIDILEAQLWDTFKKVPLKYYEKNQVLPKLLSIKDAALQLSITTPKSTEAPFLLLNNIHMEFDFLESSGCKDETQEIRKLILFSSFLRMVFPSSGAMVFYGRNGMEEEKEEHWRSVLALHDVDVLFVQ